MDEAVHEVLKAGAEWRWILAWNDESERERNEDHHEETPDALPTDNFKGWHVDILKDELFSDNLGSLDKLGKENQDRTEDLLAGGDVVFVSAGIVLADGWDLNTGNTDHDKGDGGADNAEPFVALDLLLEEEDGEDR